MEVYLTFDDGVHDGTEEVLSILEETGVKATFFLVGIELLYSYKKEAAKCLDLISQIYENHAIGNHTYSHANDSYADYYSNNGVIIDNYRNRMAIIDDFSKGKNHIAYYLKMIYGQCINDNYPLAKNQNIPLARFPGRNSWCFGTEIRKGAINNQPCRMHCESGTENPTKLLFEAGYHIFGWDTEWKMSFDFHRDAIAQKRQIQKIRGIDYSNDREVHPSFDMCVDLNLGKDRLIEAWQNVKDKMLHSIVDGKVVVLMHDRAFRKGCAARHSGRQACSCIDKSCMSEVGKLRSLINAFKALNAEFRTLDLY